MPSERARALGPVVALIGVVVVVVSVMFQIDFGDILHVITAMFD